MRNWETTLFGCIAALGQVFQHASGVPKWLNIVGEACNAVAIAGLGFSAASSRGVQKTIDEQPAGVTVEAAKASTVVVAQPPAKGDPK